MGGLTGGLVAVRSEATETACQEADAQMRILGGEIECKIHTTAAGYSDEQTHHWLIGGSGAITHTQILHIAATWSVTGNGKLAETQGNQTRKAHWNTQGTKPAPMQVRLSSPTVPATPPTIILESAHSQLSVPNGITGVQQLTIGGQPQTPGQIGLQAWGFTPFPVLLWNLKVGGPFAGQTNMTGSGAVAPMQPGKRACPNSVVVGHQAGQQNWRSRRYKLMCVRVFIWRALSTRPAWHP
jgi:hypothetical protein